MPSGSVAPAGAPPCAASGRRRRARSRPASATGSGRRAAPSPGRRPTRPQTAAERRAAEVNAKRAPRPPARSGGRAGEDREPHARAVDRRGCAARRGDRRGQPGGRRRPGRPKRQRQVAPDAVGGDRRRRPRPRRRDAAHRRGSAQAQEALDRERFDDARRLAIAAAPGAAQRGRRARGARPGGLPVRALEAGGDRAGGGAAAAPDRRAAARARRRLPGAAAVGRRRAGLGGRAGRLAGAGGARRGTHRRRRRPGRPGRPSGRAAHDGPGDAGARARSATTTCGSGTCSADLHDRAGDTLEATRWFELVARHDPDFVDVVDRLRALGR